MKKTVLVIALIVLSATISYSQVVDSTFEEEDAYPLSHGGPNRSYSGMTFSLDYLGQGNGYIRGGRFNIEMMDDYNNYDKGIVKNIEGNLFSIAVHHDYPNSIKVSFNPAASLVALGASEIIPRNTSKKYLYIVKGIFFIPLIIQILTNPSYRINLINKRLELIVGINTDYFFFYDVSRIYSEASIGLRGRFKNIALSANLGVPFTKGYFENKNPYFGVSALYYFERY